MNFDNLINECENYYTGEIKEFEVKITIDNPSLAWGFTYYETFIKVIQRLPKPKRFVVFGCSIGYQCFFLNNLYPDIKIIGIDLLDHRIDWGNEKIEEYSIKNVELIHGDICDFEIQDGDLIWQNDLLISEDLIFNLTLENLRKDVNIISYQNIHCFNDGGELIFLQDEIIKIDNDFYQIIVDKVSSKTSWSDNSMFYIFSKQKYHWGDLSENIKVQFDVNFIYPELIIPEKNLKNYEAMILTRKDVEIEIFKTLYNKNNLKKLFIEFKFNVPETYIYSTEKKDITNILNNLEAYVAKPAHMSESVNVIINNLKSAQSQFVNDVMNKSLAVSDYENFRKNKIPGGVWWKNCERGFIIEQLINVKWELKIFVIWGEPFVGDLRTSKTEFSRVDFISKQNNYLNWDDEFEKIKKLAQYLKVDFFRIDFLYDGEKLWASELAFMPGTLFPEQIEERILQEWRQPYFRHYYPFLC